MLKRLLYALFWVVYYVPMVLMLIATSFILWVCVGLIWIVTGENKEEIINDAGEWLFSVPNRIFKYDN